MNRPPAISGLRHVALNTGDLAAAEAFYVGLLGFTVEWRPDGDNVYLTSGNDNLALHKTPGNSPCDDTPARIPARVPDEVPGEVPTETQDALDHIGIILDTPDTVDQWHDFLVSHQIHIEQPPRTHRDGARSFYCRDPDGNKVQMIYHPPLSDK